MGNNYDWEDGEDYISMGKDDEALMDTPEVGTKPMIIYCYQCVCQPLNPLSY